MSPFDFTSALFREEQRCAAASGGRAQLAQPCKRARTFCREGVSWREGWFQGALYVNVINDMGESIVVRLMMETASLVLVNEFGKGWGWGMGMKSYWGSHVYYTKTNMKYVC